jgi:hypothetical protein
LREVRHHLDGSDYERAARRGASYDDLIAFVLGELRSTPQRDA